MVLVTTTASRNDVAYPRTRCFLLCFDCRSRICFLFINIDHFLFLQTIVFLIKRNFFSFQWIVFFLLSIVRFIFLLILGMTITVFSITIAFLCMAIAILLTFYFRFFWCRCFWLLFRFLLDFLFVNGCCSSWCVSSIG